MSKRPRPSRTPPTSPSKDERIEILVKLMQEGRYKTGRTPRELGAKWGLGWTTVENDACEAARIIRIGPEKRDEFRARSQLRIERAIEEALKRGNYIAYARLEELALKVAGINLEEAPRGTREPLVVEFVDASDATDEDHDPARAPPTAGAESAATG